MKKVLLTIIAGLAIATASAQNTKNFEGFSASIGMNFNNVDAKAGSDNGTDNYWIYGGDYYEGSFTRPSNSSVVPSFNVSYTKALKGNWLIGAGVTYNAAPINAGNYSQYGWYDGYEANQTINNLVSVSLAPTYALTSDFAVSAKVSYNFATAAYNEQYYVDVTESINGLGWGLAAKLNVKNNVFVQAGIDQVLFNEITYTENWEDYYQQNMKNTLTSFNLSLGYKF